MSNGWERIANIIKGCDRAVGNVAGGGGKSRKLVKKSRAGIQNNYVTSELSTWAKNPLALRSNVHAGLNNFPVSTHRHNLIIGVAEEDGSKILWGSGGGMFISLLYPFRGKANILFIKKCQKPIQLSARAWQVLVSYVLCELFKDLGAEIGM